jgi:hypothetical protein
MKERPIIFNGAMVRSILAGTKNQTRRVVKPWQGAEPSNKPVPADIAYLPDFTCYRSTCPYGKPGDRLWVRESHWWFEDESDPATGYYPPKLTVEDVDYRADGDDGRKVWRPSIHMHRWASRITLEITDVRVERLQGISDADAEAEGVERYHDGIGFKRGSLHGDQNFVDRTAFPKLAYQSIWELINGFESWAANPWVWCVEFKRIKP